MADIFVSYSSEDLMRVKPLVVALEEKGWSVWWDRELVAGHNFDREIEKALDAARCVVVVWSSSSTESTWVRTEANEGLEREILVPLLIDNVKPPLAFRMAQTAKMTDWPSQRGQLDTVVKGVTQLLGTHPVDTNEAEYEQKPIAVLPFVNMSNDPDNEYFSDGIAEEILNVLVRTNSVPVIARTSSFQFKGQNLDVQKIGVQLGISHLLEGSVRKSGNRVRVTAQLINTTTGIHLWSDKYDRDMDDVFVVQDEIAGMIVEQIGNTLDGEQKVRFFAEIPGWESQSRGTANPVAHDVLLRGIQLLNTDNPFVREESLAYFDQAIALDDSYVDAWALKGLALASLGQPNTGLRIPAEVNPQAMEAFRRALELDPNHAVSMGSLGNLLIVQEFKWNEGLQLMKRSIELSPNSAPLLATYGMYLTQMRREGAQKVLDRAHRLNPLGPGVIQNRAGALVAEGKNQDAAALIEGLLINNSEGFVANYLAAFFAVGGQRTDKLRGHLEKARQVVGEDYPNLRFLEFVMKLFETQPDSAGFRELEDEILNMAENNRVGHLLEIPWSSEESICRAWDIVVRQRHHEISAKLFESNPPFMSQARWQQIQNVTHATDVMLGTATNLLARSREEQEQLHAMMIELSTEELDRFVGTYRQDGVGMQFTVKRVDNHLLVRDMFRILPVGSTSFTALEIKIDYRFVVTDGRVTSVNTEEGQTITTWIRNENL